MTASDNPPWSLTAAGMREAYRAGALDPEQVLEACLERLDEVNPALNAVVTLDRAGARAAAAAARTRWHAGAPLSPLDGVPITVKDNLFVAGLRATWGSLLFRDLVPDRDDLSIARLRAAGVVILGKTNTPELALAGHTSNRLFGSTGNPWAADLTPGGSSGGAAAAVMSGMAPIAIATDAGGSTRRPACHTGCIGLKTSLGRVKRRYGFPALASDLQSVGIIARSTADAEAALATMAGAVAASAPRPLRIGCFAAVGDAPLDPEVEARYRESICLLRDLGHATEEIAAPYALSEVDPVFRGLACAGVARALAPFPDWREHATPQIAAMAEAGMGLAAPDYLALLDRVTEFRFRIADLFEAFDMLLTPTAAALPWPREDAFPATIAGRPADARGSAIYTTFANLAGLPAISVPARASAGGLPIGIQILGPRGADADVLALAAAIEARAPWPSLAAMPVAQPAPAA